MKNLKAWILLIIDYFTLIQTCNKQQQLTLVSLCTEGEALQCWKPKKHKYEDWEKFKDAIRE